MVSTSCVKSEMNKPVSEEKENQMRTELEFEAYGRPNAIWLRINK